MGVSRRYAANKRRAQSRRAVQHCWRIRRVDASRQRLREFGEVLRSLRGRAGRPSQGLLLDRPQQRPLHLHLRDFLRRARESHIVRPVQLVARTHPHRARLDANVAPGGGCGDAGRQRPQRCPCLGGLERQPNIRGGRVGHGPPSDHRRPACIGHPAVRHSRRSDRPAPDAGEAELRRRQPGGRLRAVPRFRQRRGRGLRPVGRRRTAVAKAVPLVGRPNDAGYALLVPR